MKLVIAAVGRLKAGPECDLAAHYGSRIDALGRSLRIGPSSPVEIVESRAATAAARQDAEGAALLARTGAGAELTGLDRSGQLMTSRDLADLLRALQDAGCREAAFLVGGPDGHAASTLARCNRILSLGRITLPHGLARIVLAEQLYRGLTILAGHPYHRE